MCWQGTREQLITGISVGTLLRCYLNCYDAAGQKILKHAMTYLLADPAALRDNSDCRPYPVNIKSVI